MRSPNALSLILPGIFVILIGLGLASCSRLGKPERKEAPPTVAPETPETPARPVAPERAPSPAAPEPVDIRLFARIDALCSGVIANGHAPGVVLAAGRGDDVLFRKAYGYRMRAPRAEPMTLDTLFDIASLTKPTCTAAAVMLLVQDGRLALDDPVALHVTEFANRDKRDVTIAQLLTQDRKSVV